MNRSKSDPVGCQSPKPAVDIIWTTTMICPHDCDICCVDATHVTQRNGHISIRTRGLTEVRSLPIQPKSGNLFEQALDHRQQEGKELRLEDKLRVLDHLDGFHPKIDFSGGDALVVRENLVLMREAKARFGRAQLTLTVTGAGLFACNVEDIAPLVSEMNFTYDSPHVDGLGNRPDCYARTNLGKARQFVEMGTPVRAECPLSKENISEETLRSIYLNLHRSGIPKLLLMRLFPVGRGAKRSSSIPSAEEYVWAIEFMHKMESDYGSPTVKLQCALRHLGMPQASENPCDLIRESFGLTADGTLLASPWAINAIGEPLADTWILGNLARTPLREILQSEKTQTFIRHLDDNFGHCKIFSFLNSTKLDPFDRVVDQADPLYTVGRTSLVQIDGLEPHKRAGGD